MIKLKKKNKGIRRLLGKYRKVPVGFSFTHYAWFFAFDYLNIDPYQFEEVEDREWREIVLMYGAYKWWCFKNRKKVKFTPETIREALRAETVGKAEEIGEKIGKLRKDAVFPEWMEAIHEEETGAKKKSQKKKS